MPEEQIEPRMIGYSLSQREYEAVTTALGKFPYAHIESVMKILENLPVLHDNPVAPEPDDGK